ncbi:hypothetical protein D3C87_1015920 [compost metagenome]
MEGFISLYEYQEKCYIFGSTKGVNLDSISSYRGEAVSYSSEFFEMFVKMKIEGFKMADIVNILKGESNIDKRFIFEVKDTSGNEGYVIQFNCHDISGYDMNDKLLICKIETKDIIGSIKMYEEFYEKNKDKDIKNLLKREFRVKKTFKKCNVRTLDLQFFAALKQNVLYYQDDIQDLYIKFIAKESVSIADVTESVVYKNFSELTENRKIDSKADCNLWYNINYNVYIYQKNIHVQIFKFNSSPVEEFIPYLRYFEDFLIHTKFNIQGVYVTEIMFQKYLYKRGLPIILSRLVLESNIDEYVTKITMPDHVTYIQSII